MRKLSVHVQLIVFTFLLGAGGAEAASPKNVIFMIGDGMGLNHVKAAGMYAYGAPGTLCFESLPYQAQVSTYSVGPSVTDSAAAATALATGTKVNNGVISMAYPGSGAELQTLLEFYKLRGARTALVTSDAITGATPGGFGAHEASRNNTSNIASDYLNQTRPNVLLGGGGAGMTSSAATAAGYTVVTSRTAMQGIDTNVVSMLSGQFGTSGSMPYEYDGIGSLPHLSQMIVTALDIVDNDPNGFFLLVEGGNIDHAAHSNDITRDVYETVEFNNTVQAAINWAAGRADTLIIVTADHETGGMSNPQNQGQGNMPIVSWSTTGHTGVNVGAWAWGVNAQYITGTIDNTQFFKIITAPLPVIALSPASLSKAVRWGTNLPANTDSFNISNTGLGTCSYTIASDANWVWPTTFSGSCTTETDTIGIAYSTAGLSIGQYEAHLTVTSNEATNSPQAFTLTLNVQPVPGDFDADGDVDQEDYGHLQVCLSSGSVPAGCTDADFNSNNIIDQTEVTTFFQCLSGAGVPASPTCAN